jgi:hypothetical protein
VQPKVVMFEPQGYVCFDETCDDFTDFKLSEHSVCSHAIPMYDGRAHCEALAAKDAELDAARRTTSAVLDRARRAEELLESTLAQAESFRARAEQAEHRADQNWAAKEKVESALDAVRTRAAELLGACNALSEEIGPEATMVCLRWLDARRELGAVLVARPGEVKP